MKSKTLITIVCLTGFLSGCLPATNEALYKDVARKPPIKRGTVEYIVANDRPFAEWVEEMAAACDVHGCS